MFLEFFFFFRVIWWYLSAKIQQIILHVPMMYFKHLYEIHLGMSWDAIKSTYYVSNYFLQSIVIVETRNAEYILIPLRV